MSFAFKLDWNLLRTFVVVAEEESISRAAAVLHRGQPAVSSALKRLEQQIGQKLAERSATGFVLTEAGRILYREAKEVFGGIDRVSTLLSDFSGELTGGVNLTLASYMVSPLIDQALLEFHRRFSMATINITVMTSPEILQAMNNRLIYFGIGPISTMQEEFEYFHIFKEHCSFYCGPSHPLYGIEDLSLEDLKNQRAVTHPAAIYSDVLQPITDMRQRVKFSEPFVGISRHLEEIRRMIVAGIGIGPIPTHIAERDVRDGLLWRLPPYEPAMPINVYLITNPQLRPSRVEQAFIEVLKEVVSATPYEERVYP